MRGFTIVQVIVVVVVLLLVFSLSLKLFSVAQQRQHLREATENVVSLLTEAHASSVFHKESSQYGVYLTSTSSVLFQGDSFSSTTPRIQEYLLPKSIIMTYTLNGSGDEVVFNTITGTTEQYGTVTLSAIQNTSTTQTIRIEEAGFIDIL